MLHLMSRRSFLLATVGGFALLALPGCESFAGNAVVIYSCAEGVRNESLLTALRSRFPSYVRHSAALRSDRELRCQTQNGGIPIRGRYRARP